MTFEDLRRHGQAAMLMQVGESDPHVLPVASMYDRRRVHPDSFLFDAPTLSQIKPEHNTQAACHPTAEGDTISE